MQTNPKQTELFQTESKEPQSFLESLASGLLAKFGNNMLRVAVVIPNTRGILYLKDAFAQLVNQPLLLPTMLSMDMLVDLISEGTTIDTYEAQLYLHQSFRRIRQQDESFETFLPLAQTLLADFEEIVRNEKPLRLIYTELEKWESTGIGFADFMEPEQIELLQRFWSYLGNDASVQRQRFADLWRSLPAVFTDFETRMRADGKRTSAMAYADAAKILGRSEVIQRFDVVYFVGFGQLSGSEISIVKILKELQKAELIWDINNRCFVTPEHEVTRLFTRLKRNPVLNLSIEAQLQSTTSNQNKPAIEIVKCTGLDGMGQYIQSVIDSGSRTNNLAVIATDPGLVQTLLENTNQGSFPFNITMGFPLAYTREVQWINQVLEWMGRTNYNDSTDLVALYRNSPLEKYFPLLASEWERIAYTNPVETYNLQEIKRNLKQSPAWLWAENATDWLTRFDLWVKELEVVLPIGSFEEVAWKNLEVVFSDLMELSKLMDKAQFTFGLLQKLLPSLLQKHSLAIEGSYKTGVQVMGLFESRLLDFDHVIVAPAHEGNFPTSTQSQSFLTENVRRAFGLLTRNQRIEDEVYQFDRLTYRSKRITLLISDSSDIKPSRIVEQLRYSKVFDVKEFSQQFNASLPLPVPFSFAKNAYFHNEVKVYFSKENVAGNKALSPSSLYDLLACHLRFYFSRVEKLQPPEELKGVEMDTRDFGNWVHNTIQNLYEQQGKAGHILQRSDFETMKTDWQSAQYIGWNEIKGKSAPYPLDEYLIEKEVGKRMAFRFFDAMANEKPHRWIANELKLDRIYLPSGESETKEWAVEGRADLILQSETETWLIDLKTGSFEKPSFYFIKPDKLDGLEIKLLKKKDLFQMVMYNWLAFKSTKAPFTDRSKNRAKLFYMADPEGSLIDPFQNLSRSDEVDQIFEKLEEILKTHLEMLVDHNIPILQTDDQTKCLYCDFAPICQRV